MKSQTSTLQHSDTRVAQLSDRFRDIRSATESLCEPLLPEDYTIQSMPDVSPPKWHLAHTTWFFENFVLAPHVKDFKPFHPAFKFLFNSYYKSVGTHFERHKRGLLSRPCIGEIYRYRRHVDQHLLELLQNPRTAKLVAPLIELGLQHEQQHQELLLMDIKHIFWSNPLRPSYIPSELRVIDPAPSTHESDKLINFAEGITELGTDENFSFDNERPRHRVFLEAFGIHSRSVTNGEYLEFIEAGGYQEPRYWLSDGWDLIQKEGWTLPLYWEKHDSGYQLMTLNGMKPLEEREPVCHVSYFEADAFARWRGCRLPTEAEWERAAGAVATNANFAESRFYHPQPDGPSFFGNAWEWTSSAYGPYPGFKTLPSSLGEYNGKFMCNQMVLRGGSCVTPRLHIRPSYRNFFQPHCRWQFSGIRLALGERAFQENPS